MKTFEDLIKDSLPEGSIYYGVIESNDENISIVQFSLKEEVYESEITKINLSNYFIDPVIVKYVNGLTYENLYDIINEQFGLGLEKGIDYNDSGKINFVKNEIITLTIAKKSYGYTGMIPIYLYSNRTNIIRNEGNCDLEQVNMKPFFIDKIIQSKLGYKLFTSAQGKLFTSSLISLAFKNELKEYLKDMEQIYVEDLIAGYIEKAFSDDLSDIISLRTQKGYLYHVRFKSDKGDIPR